MRKSRAEYYKKYNHSEKGIETNLRCLYKKYYGLTLDEVKAQEKIQDYKCAICKESPKGYFKRLCVDHNKQDGNIRGLLCNPCNQGLGYFKHKRELLLKASNYLKTTEKIHVEGNTIKDITTKLNKELKRFKVYA